MLEQVFGEVQSCAGEPLGPRHALAIDEHPLGTCLAADPGIAPKQRPKCLAILDTPRV